MDKSISQDSGLILGGIAFLAAGLVRHRQAGAGGAWLGITGPDLCPGLALVSEIVPIQHRSSRMLTICAGITVAGFASPFVAGHLISAGGKAGDDHALTSNVLVVLCGGVVGLIFLRPDLSKVRLMPTTTQAGLG